MMWTQKMIAEWAKSQFGYHGPRPIAIRGNKEMAELLSSLENNIPAEECAEECADVAIFLLQVCERLGFDLLELVDKKMEINIARTWTIGSDGSHQHVEVTHADAPYKTPTGHLVSNGNVPIAMTRTSPSTARNSDMEKTLKHGKWENRFMDMAELVAGWSKDPSTKVGAVLVSGRTVLGLGYNGFPSGCDDSPAIYENREEKYRRVVHAEVNALLSAQGKTKEDMELYSTLCPCSQCAAMMINFGVKVVYFPVPTQEQLDRWGASFETTLRMFREARVMPMYLPNR